MDLRTRIDDLIPEAHEEFAEPVEFRSVTAPRPPG